MGKDVQKLTCKHNHSLGTYDESYLNSSLLYFRYSVLVVVELQEALQRQMFLLESSEGVNQP